MSCGQSSRLTDQSVQFPPPQRRHRVRVWFSFYTARVLSAYESIIDFVIATLYTLISFIPLRKQKMCSY